MIHDCNYSLIELSISRFLLNSLTRILIVVKYRIVVTLLIVYSYRYWVIIVAEEATGYIAPRLDFKILFSELGYPSGWAWRKKTPVATDVTRSLLRSRCSRCSAPRLASSRYPAGPGSLELMAPITRRWGSMWHLPRAFLVPAD